MFKEFHGFQKYKHIFVFLSVFLYERSKTEMKLPRNRPAEKNTTLNN